MMHQTIKNTLGVVLIVLALAGTVGLVRMSNAYSRSIDPATARSFTVTGESKVVVVPDVAQFTFGVTTQGGRDLAQLQKENTQKVNEAIAYVKSKNVDAKDIATSQYQVEPRYQYSSCASGICPPPQIVGYTVLQRVTVKVRDFAAASDILAGVVERGANDVSQLTFTVDDLEAIRTTARINAIAKAREKATAIAKAGNVRVGKLLSMDDGSTSTAFQQMGYGGGARMNTMMYDAALEAKAVEAPAPAIEAGSQEITVSVTLRYAIQ